MAQFLIKGKVIDDDDGLGIPKASIKVKGTDQGTVTSMDGDFEIYVSVGDTLMFSYVAYWTREVTIRDASDLLVRMKPQGTFDDFGYDRLHFYTGREVLNGMFGGKISYVSDLIGMRALEPSISYYGSNNRSFTEARLKLLSPLYPDRLLDTSVLLQFQNQNFDLDDSFESITLSLQPILPYVDGNIGLGLIEFGETGKTWGLLFGLSKELKIAQFHYIPVEASAILWNQNFQFNLLAKYRIN